MSFSDLGENTQVFFDPKGDLQIFFQHINQAIAAGAKGLLLITAEANDFDIALVNQKLMQLPVPVCGGIFPKIINQIGSHSKGSIVCGFDFAIQVAQVKRLSDANEDFNKQLEQIAQVVKPNKSMMLLVDGNSRYISRFMENVYYHLGNEVTCFGGGAGTLKLVPSPCLFTNEGLLADGAQLITIDSAPTVAVEHGWEKLAGPFVITESNHNVIQMIDYLPAFKTYKKIIESNSTHHFDNETFFDISKYFPFGIESYDGSMIVRDPISVTDNGIVCVGEVPENSIVYILKGSYQNLVSAAENVAKKAAKAKDVDLHIPVILFDCISRSLILGNQYTDELKVISANLPKNSHIIGASSIGEIATTRSGLLEFHNKTVVLALFGRS